MITLCCSYYADYPHTDIHHGLQPSDHSHSWVILTSVEPINPYKIENDKKNDLKLEYLEWKSNALTTGWPHVSWSRKRLDVQSLIFLNSKIYMLSFYVVICNLENMARRNGHLPQCWNHSTLYYCKYVSGSTSLNLVPPQITHYCWLIVFWLTSNSTIVSISVEKPTPKYFYLTCNYAITCNLKDWCHIGKFIHINRWMI